MSDVDREMARKTRRAFLTGGIASAAGVGGWAWLRSREPEAGIAWPLRKALGLNERVARAYFSPARMARTFEPAAIQEGRVNGQIGLEDELEDWKLTIEGGPALTLDNIKALPKTEMITELKCIEGWERILKWGGVRFADFVAKFVPSAGKQGYVALETPDQKYYVGLDMESALHPQTLLAYEMNGADLEDEHGAPLRLVIPVKYGIKNLKRIGRIGFSDTKPRDYWAERGYDWYAGF